MFARDKPKFSRSVSWLFLIFHFLSLQGLQNCCSEIISCIEVAVESAVKFLVEFAVPHSTGVNLRVPRLFHNYEAHNDYTNNSEANILRNSFVCNSKIHSQTINACNWHVHRKYLMKALDYTKEFVPASPV